MCIRCKEMKPIFLDYIFNKGNEAGIDCVCKRCKAKYRCETNKKLLILIGGLSFLLTVLFIKICLKSILSVINDFVYNNSNPIIFFVFGIGTLIMQICLIGIIGFVISTILTWNGNIEIVRNLLANGADVNSGYEYAEET